jgi:Predicted S-adenosylmethionine-dependent methyltransferase involved in cell envelope biogenesis
MSIKFLISRFHSTIPSFGYYGTTLHFDKGTENLLLMKTNFGWSRRLLDGRKIRFYSRKCNAQLKNVPHVPVMANEVLEYLKPSAKEIFVDMTFGAGGHTTRILESVPDIKIFALDRDPVAHDFAKELAQKYPEQVVPLLGRFSELPQLLKKHNVTKNMIDGFLV